MLKKSVYAVLIIIIAVILIFFHLKPPDTLNNIDQKNDNILQMVFYLITLKPGRLLIKQIEIVYLKYTGERDNGIEEQFREVLFEKESICT